MKMKKVKILKEMPRLMIAPFVVGLMALTLYLLGMVPAILQNPAGVREYSNLEQAEAELGFEVVIPAYFPSYLFWPPVKILGQLEPTPMAQVLFLASDQHTETLLIYQIISDKEDLPVAFPWIETVLQEMPVSINDTNGELLIGRGTDDRLLNGVHWMKDGVHFIVVTTHPLRELLTIATSMHP